jgi:membrane protease YdiL (CAAX protease family)
MMAAVSILVVALGELAPVRESHGTLRAKLYGRGGDTYMGMYYLTHARGWKEEDTRIFLEKAQDYYLLSLQADPSEMRIQVSLALLLDASGRQQEARQVISQLLTQELPRDLRRDLTSVFAIIVSTRTRHKQVDIAYDLLAGTGPGRMTLARAYDGMGEEALAQAEWDDAEAESQPLLRSVAVMIAICGAMVLVGLLGILWIIARRLRGPHAIPESREPPERAAWTTREALEALIIWIFSGLVCGFVFAVMAPGDEEPGIMALIMPHVLGGLLASAWVRVSAGRGAILGWRGRRALQAVASGIAAAGLCALPVLWVYQFLQELLGEGLADAPLLPLIVAGRSWEWKVFVLAALCGVVPAIEETLFRSVLFGALRRQWACLPAAAVSAAVFAVAHMHFAGLATYFMLGLLFAYLYERSGSLIAPWAAHGAFNGFNLAILLTLFG